MQIFVGGADTKLVANKSVTQKFEQLTPAEKPERLMKVIMEQPADAKIVVFCNTKADCAKLEADQKRLGRGTCAIDETRAMGTIDEPRALSALDEPRALSALDETRALSALAEPRARSALDEIPTLSVSAAVRIEHEYLAPLHARAHHGALASPQGRVPSTATRINGNVSARCMPFRPARRPSCSRPTWRREGSMSAE
jgi:hypothetical protein